jgi:hypothetical protein
MSEACTHECAIDDSNAVTIAATSFILCSRGMRFVCWLCFLCAAQFPPGQFSITKQQFDLPVLVALIL